MAPTRKLAELFYEVRARTEGLEKDMAGAERQFGKLSKFVSANLVASTAALGLAFIGVAAKATQMAAEIDTSMRKIKASLPAGAGGFDVLRRAIEGVSRATGQTQADLARASAQIAQLGAGSGEEVAQRLKAATTAAQASGEDLGGIIEGLDQILDLFAIQSRDSGRALAELFAATRGRSSLADMFALFKAAAPGLQKLGIDLGTAARALTVLGDSGLAPKQAATELKKLAEQGAEGRREIERLAGAARDAADPMQAMADAANEVNEAASNAGPRLRAEFSAAMIDLGNEILPVVNKALRGFLDLLAELRRGPSARNIEEATKALSTNAKDATTSQGAYIRAAQALQTLRNAVQQGTADFKTLGNEGIDALLGSLAQLQAGAAKFNVGGTMSENMKQELELVKTALLQARLDLFGESVAAQEGLGKTKPVSNAEAIAKQKAEAKKAAEELARIQREAREDEIAEVNRQLDKLAKLREGERRKRIEFGKALIEVDRQTLESMRGLLLDIEGEIRASGASEAEIPVLRDAELGIKSLRGSLKDLKKDLDAILGKGLRELQKRGEKDQKEREDRAKALDKETKDALLRGQQLSQQIEDIARVTLAAAGAFGEMSAEAQVALRSVVDIGSGVARIFAGDKKGGGLQTASGVTSLITSLLSKNPADAQRAKEHQENIAALKEIERHTGDLVGIQASGRDIASVTRGVEGLLALTGDAGGFRRFGDKGPLRGISEGAVLEASTGLAFKEIAALAQSLGITLNGTKQSYLDFLEALKSVDLAAFGEGFGGQMRKLEIAARLDPSAFEGMEGLLKRVKVLTGPEGAPALAEALEGLDLSTESGRAAAIERMTAVLNNIENLDPADLGGLSLDEFIEESLKLVESLRQSAADAAAEAAAARNKARSDLDRSLGFRDVTDPGKILAEKVAQALQLFPDTIGKFLQGIDVSAEGGLDAFNSQLKAAETWLRQNAVALGLTDEELEEMLATLFDLESGADAAAAAVLSLADTLNEAFAQIDLEAAIFGETAAATIGKKLSALGVGGDVSTEAGRASSVEALRALARGTTDKGMLTLIASLIGEIQSLAGAASSLSDAAKASSGSTSAITNAASNLTERTGNRMADYLLTQLVVAREHLAVDRESRNALLSFVGSRVTAPQVQPPLTGANLTTQLGAFGAVGTAPVTLNNTFNFSVTSGGVTSSGFTAAGAAETERFMRQISQRLADEIKRAQRLRGIVSQ